MSRVYRALEKAEEEKRQNLKEEPAIKVFEEKAFLKKEPSILRFPDEKIEAFGLPAKEEAPISIVSLNSFAAEEFRKLKTQIFRVLSNPPHSILITSVAPGEGKTMVAVNLSMAISREIHGKPILIDADIRKPSIHLEKNPNSNGLSNYLSDGIPLSEALIDSEIENLRIIPAGPQTSRSSELIGSKKMGELLKSLKESEGSTYIIIDSPPIISTTEPILLSRMVDGVILVVKANQTPRETISRAIKGLERQKTIGIVFNQIDLRPSSYYSKYYYKYHRK